MAEAICAEAACGPWIAWVAPLLPGAAHACSTVVVGYPFDTVKTRVQVGMHSSPSQCAAAILRQEGPLAFYRGAAMPLVSLLVKRPFEFAAFEALNKRFGKKTLGPVVGGCIAGIIAATLGCPFNVVKVQMQTNRKDVYRDTWQAVREVWRAGGPLGFYRGYSASLIMSVPSTTFYLGAYGYLREALPPSRWSIAAAGMAASLSMWTCLLPLDNVRTCIQAKPLKGDQVVSSWAQQAAAIARGPRGVRGLWAGWTAVMARSPVQSACSMLAYEHARGLADALQR